MVKFLVMIVMSGALDAVDAFVKHVEEYPVKTDGIPNQYPLEIKEGVNHSLTIWLLLLEPLKILLSMA